MFIVKYLDIDILSVNVRNNVCNKYLLSSMVAINKKKADMQQ